MKVVVVIPARTGSTRLPGKVILPLRGRPLLQRMVERVLAAHTPFELVIATTAEPEDQIIRALARSLGISCFSGHSTDLLYRHCDAARIKQADVVVSIPSNCPLIDPGAVDRVIGAFLAARGTRDYVSNLHPATWPAGNDVEVVSMEALESAHQEARHSHERDRATPFIWERPHRFRLSNVTWESGLDYSKSHRFAIDYAEDYEFVSSVYNELWSERRPVFALEEILALLRSRPDIAALNAHVGGVNRCLQNPTEQQATRPRDGRGTFSFRREVVRHPRRSTAGANPVAGRGRPAW